MPTFRSDDGLEISYRCWGPDDGTPPVVLQHGFSASAELDWVSTGTVQALTAAGRRVVALDARGHGRSAKPHDPTRYGEGRMAQDVVTLIDVLGAPAVDLVGYSMGAVIALITAARDARVRRLVVGGIGAGAVELGGVDRNVLDPAALRHALLTDEPSALTDPGSAAFRSLADETGADRLALAAVTEAIHRDQLPLGEVRVPTLVLAGRDDPLAARPHVLAGAVAGATLQLVDGGHGEALREPAFIAAIVDFLPGEPVPVG